MCADARKGTNTAHLHVASDLPLFRRLRIAMATPITNRKGFMLKPQKAHTLRAFLSSSFLFSPSQKSLLSRWAYSSFIMDPLCTGSPLFPGFARLSKCSCSWSQWEYRVFVFQLFRSAGSLWWNHPIQWLFSVLEYLGGVRSITAGLALLPYYRQKSFGAFSVSQNFKALGHEVCYIL